jgi:signal transduction histidine kinase
MVSIRKKTDNKSHLGLGLYMARLIAEFHGGSMQAKNTQKGVSFTVSLPFNTAKASF